MPPIHFTAGTKSGRRLKPRRVRASFGVLLLSISLLLGAGCASTDAQPVQPSVVSPPALTPLREAMIAGPVATAPLFWRVNADAGATLYLLGSIHFGPSSGWTMPDIIEGAFARSAALVVEADDRELSPADMQAITLRYAMAPAGSTLADLVPADTLERLDAHFAARGASAAPLMGFRPWMVSTVLTVGAITELGFSPLTGVDRRFLALAGDREVIALETIESQLAIFGDLSPKLDALFLSDTLEQLNEVEEMILGMAESWREGDERSLVSLLLESFEADDAEHVKLRDALIVDRNRAMASGLEALARDPARAGTEIFVVVGVAHFVGADHIGGMLEESGLEVRRVWPPANLAVAPDSGGKDADVR